MLLGIWKERIDSYDSYTVQLLTLACTILAYCPWILARNSQDVCESFYFTRKRMRTIQLLSNLLVSKFHKCESRHEHKKKLETLLDMNLTIHTLNNL